MINDKFPLSIGEEMVRNERTLLSKVEDGKMMMSADSVRFLVLHCSATRRNQDIALQESFKKLILKHNFDKITIKMITDDAGLIRPTFYNHYADKYEVLEEIFYNDIFKGSKMLIENKMPYEAIYYMFSRIESNKKF